MKENSNEYCVPNYCCRANLCVSALYFGGKGVYFELEPGQGD